ncbi:MAG TPA: alpha-isopropylmalate synthase regulatory domain-containing protein [Candidatus Saccharimonadales bacterium]|nr:alpha-isopropylmalate synthase regulatory domain-containing protein [Candidatus Saccharimonadales bacterium]
MTSTPAAGSAGSEPRGGASDAAGPAGSATAGPETVLQLVRWTVNSGSNVQSRGAVVMASGAHQWEGAAEGNGPVDAVFRAVDRALRGVLAGEPRLLAYDVHAVAEGPDAVGLVTIEIAPPASATGERATGRYSGRASNANIIAASVEAYIQAINELLAEAHWAGATEDAGNQRRTRTAGGRVRRAQLDEDEAKHDTTAWFER